MSWVADGKEGGSRVASPLRAMSSSRIAATEKCGTAQSNICDPATLSESTYDEHWQGDESTRAKKDGGLWMPGTA
jgi:hypothetical protein